MPAPNYPALLQSLIDVLLESQIKIGYTENPVGLYYPLGSLCRLLGVEADLPEMDALLAGAPEEPLGKLTVSHSGERYCLTVPAEGARYVHEHVQDTGFLTDLIALLSGHSHSIGVEDILAVFRRYSDQVVCCSVDTDEFDYLVYFADGKPDAYRYLISMEMGHVSYHRFTPADYAAFGYPASPGEESSHV